LLNTQTRASVGGMTPTQINRHLARAGAVLVRLNQLTALRDAAQLAAEQLPVRWIFDPGTPATVVDYLAGGARGAVTGAAVGLGIEIVLAALLPGVALGYALLGGAVAGAVRGVAQVEQGWRVRLIYAGDGEPLLEVRQTS
jgi:hypothetical protein